MSDPSYNILRKRGRCPPSYGIMTKTKRKWNLLIIGGQYWDRDENSHWGAPAESHCEGVFLKTQRRPGKLFWVGCRFQRAWQYIDIQVWRGSLLSIQHDNQWQNLGKTSNAVQKDSQPEAWTSWGIGKKRKKPRNETHIFQNPEASAASYIAGKVFKLLHHNALWQSCNMSEKSIKKSIQLWKLIFLSIFTENVLIFAWRFLSSPRMRRWNIF